MKLVISITLSASKKSLTYSDKFYHDKMNSMRVAKSFILQIENTTKEKINRTLKRAEKEVDPHVHSVPKFEISLDQEPADEEDMMLSNIALEKFTNDLMSKNLSNKELRKSIYAQNAAELKGADILRQPISPCSTMSPAPSWVKKDKGRRVGIKLVNAGKNSAHLWIIFLSRKYENKKMSYRSQARAETLKRSARLCSLNDKCCFA